MGTCASLKPYPEADPQVQIAMNKRSSGALPFQVPQRFLHHGHDDPQCLILQECRFEALQVLLLAADVVALRDGGHCQEDNHLDCSIQRHLVRTLRTML